MLCNPLLLRSVTSKVKASPRIITRPGGTTRWQRLKETPRQPKLCNESIRSSVTSHAKKTTSRRRGRNRSRTRSLARAAVAGSSRNAAGLLKKTRTRCPKEYREGIRALQPKCCPRELSCTVQPWELLPRRHRVRTELRVRGRVL